MRRTAAILALVIVAACAQPSPAEAPANSRAADVAAHKRVTLVDPAPNTTDKVLVFVIENKSFAQIKAGAPKLWALGQQYAHATNFQACTHPSLPNYICMAAGSTLGVKDNKNPSSHKLKAANVFGGAWANGRTAKVIADGMGSDRCRQSNYHSFAVRHTGWPYFPADRKLCERYMFNESYYAGDVKAARLANVELFVASNAHNAHDGSLKTADNWHAARIATAMAGPDWKAGRLTIVITADEDDKKSGNRIYTAVLHPSLKGKVVTTPLTLPSLSGLLSDFGHSPRLTGAKTAPDMAAAFGLNVQ